MNEFHYALTQANLLYGIEILPEDFEEIGLIAWNFIGNKRTRTYRYSAKVNCNTLTVELPCNADIVEAVTYCFEDWNHTSNKHVDGDYDSQFTEHYIENLKAFENPLYQSGRYAKFERVGDILYFDQSYGTVNILYKGVILDDDGLPMLNDKECIAIATYVAYTQKFKEGMLTNNKDIIAIAQTLQQAWLRYVDAARVPEYLTQNDMNEVLEAKSSWNRKIFNKSYKPIR